MSTPPLSDKMRHVLVAMADLEKESAYGSSTPNEIAYRCGYKPTMARSGNHGSGNVARVMGVAVHVTTALTALRKRGLVGFGRRADGLSGTAYFLSEEGRREATKAAEVPGIDGNAARAEGKKTERQRWADR